MNTELGVTPESMATSGFREMLAQAGRPIATDTGFGLIRGDGAGSMTSLGAMLRSTMEDGFMPAAFGDGHPGLTTLGHTMLRRWLHGSAAASDSELASAADSDGAHWGLASHSFHGMG